MAFDLTPRQPVRAHEQRLPVIGIDSGGTSEIITDGETGYLVPPNDPAALAAKLKGLWADEQLRSDLGERARKEALDRFSPARSMNDLISACESVARRPAG